MTLVKCVGSGYRIDYMVTLPNTRAQRPREDSNTPPRRYLLRTAPALSGENHAGKKLLCLPQGSTPEVCLSFKLLPFAKRFRINDTKADWK